MNLNQIKSFLAITKTLNFTAAARQLQIPQSTISRQINDLEAQLEVRLFYRTKRDVHLTDEGRTFLPFAREIAEAADKGTKAVQKLNQGGAGHLSIATVPAAEDILCSYLDTFHKKYPAIVVDIHRLSAGFTLMEDIDSAHDFYFIYSDMMAAADEYGSIMTHREPIGLVMSRGSMDGLTGPKGNASLPVDRLSSEDFLMMSEEADPILYMQSMNYCRTHRFTPHIINSFTDVPSLLLALKSGIGVSFLPASVAESTGDERLVFIPLDEESYSIPCIAAWKTSLLNPASKLFLEILDRDE